MKAKMYIRSITPAHIGSYDPLKLSDCIRVTEIRGAVSWMLRAIVGGIIREEYHNNNIHSILPNKLITFLNRSNCLRVFPEALAIYYQALFLGTNNHSSLISFKIKSCENINNIKWIYIEDVNRYKTLHPRIRLLLLNKKARRKSFNLVGYKCDIELLTHILDNNLSRKILESFGYLTILTLYILGIGKATRRGLGKFITTEFYVDNTSMPINLKNIEDFIDKVKSQFRDLLTDKKIKNAVERLHNKGIITKRVFDNIFNEEDLIISCKNLQKIRCDLSLREHFDCTKLFFSLFPIFAKLKNAREKSYIIIPKNKKCKFVDSWKDLARLNKKLFLSSKDGILTRIRVRGRYGKKLADVIFSWIAGLPRYKKLKDRKLTKYKKPKDRILKQIHIELDLSKDQLIKINCKRKKEGRNKWYRRASPFIIFRDFYNHSWKLLAFISIDWPPQIKLYIKSKCDDKIKVYSLKRAYTLFLREAIREF